MGIFSSTYKTYVGTSISRFADTDAFISSKKKGLISGIARNEDVTDHTLDSLINSSGFRAKKAFRYGESSYTFGRPNDTLFAKSGSNATINTAVTNYLTGLGASEVYYVRYGPYSYDHKFYKHLQSGFNLNFATGFLPGLSVDKGSDVTLFEAALLSNPSNTLEDYESLIPIAVYPIVRKSSTAVERIGAEITYRWEKEVESINHTYDSVGPVLDSTNTFSDYSGGTTSYTNTSVSSTTEVLAPIIENSTVPADPPNTYAPTEIELRTVTTKKTTTTIVDHYTVNPTLPIALYDFSSDISVSGETDVYSGILNSGVSYTFSVIPLPGSTLSPSMLLTEGGSTALATGAFFVYTPTATKTYYLAIWGTSNTTGGYKCTITYPGTPPSVGTLVRNTYILEENDHKLITTTKTYNQESLLFSSNFGITTEVLSKTFFMAGYNLSGITFLDYESNTGIAELDKVFSTSYSVPGDYLPRLYFRWNHISEGLDKNTVAYTNGKKLAKKIGINYDDVIEAVHKIDEDRTQADLDQIRSVFLTYALPADATDQVELKYLFKHFKDWHAVIGGYTTTEFLGDFNTNYQLSDSNEHVLVIEDKRFKITIGMQGIWKRTVTGVFDSVGKYGTLKGKMLVEIYLEGGSSTVRTFPWHVYRHQTNENTYEEYQVVGLETKYYVEGDHHSASGYTSDVADAKDILYVPINYTLVQEFTLFEQEELMYKSMQIVANSLVVVKVKWYQRGGWSTLFKIAAIVAAFYGYSKGLSWVSGIAAGSITVAMAIEALWFYLKDLLFKYIAAYVFVKVAGEDLAMLTAIYLAAKGYIQGGGLTSVYATEMLQYSNSIFTEINASIKREFASLRDDYNSFITEAKTEFKEISDELKKFENPNKNLTAYLLNSTPTEFLNKTYIGNIGTKVFDVTRNYVDMSLRLPYRPTYSEV